MGMNSFAKAILFHTEKATFKPGVTKELDGMIAIMNKFPLATFAIRGYTDTTGSVTGNLKLSDKRANAVRNYLVENGIDTSRLTAKGYGQESPIDTNDTRAGRANNRRVEVKVTN
jgi:outer membrane protein OmpA-like peptidoglycan-associated protein